MAIVKTSQATKKPVMSPPAPQTKATIVTSKDVKRGPGRPPKPKTQETAQATVAAPPSAPKGLPPNAVPLTAFMPPKTPPQAPAPQNLTGIALKELMALAQALNARVEHLEKTITTLAEKGAKKTNTNTVDADSLINGISIPDNDWRTPYHGAYVHLYKSDLDKKGDLTVYDNEEPIRALLVVPRDFDPGNNGALARSGGKIAAYWAQAEDGSYQGEPGYYTQEELSACWAEPE